MLILITDLLITDYFYVLSEARHQFQRLVTTPTLTLKKRVHQAGGVLHHFL